MGANGEGGGQRTEQADERIRLVIGRHHCIGAATAILILPLLHGCAAGVVAAQLIPVAITGTSASVAEKRDPFVTRAPSSQPRTDADFAILEAQIKAAECGNPRSQFWLASAIKNGYNATPDNVEIYKWFRLAEMGSFEPASEQLAALDTSMAESEIVEARRRASQWKPASEGCAADG